MHAPMKAVAVLIGLSMPVVVGSVDVASAQRVAGMSTQDWYQRIESTRRHANNVVVFDDHPWVLAKIKAIDAGAGQMTVSHGAIPRVKMPAMTMTFPVKTPGELGSHRTGDTIQMQVADDGGVIKIVHVRNASGR